MREAEPLYRRLLAAQPSHAEGNHLLGLLCVSGGRAPEAVPLLEEAVRSSPREASFRSSLGVALEQCGRLGEAEAAHLAALSLDPARELSLSNLANTLRLLGRPAEAASHLRRAVGIAPCLAEIRVNLGLVLADLQDLDGAVASLREGVRLSPQLARAHSCLGNALREAGALAEALEAGRRAVGLAPRCPDCLNDLGVTLGRLMRTAEAAACYRGAIALDPGHVLAHANLGMSLLMRGGSEEEGWREFEWRWRTAPMAVDARSFDRPAWDGAEGGGRTLLIYSEQGLGDTIQFCRYAAGAARRGWRVVAEVQPPLARLLAAVPGIDAVAARGGPLPPFDAHCAMLRLPAILGSDPWQPPCPYIRPDPSLAASWAARTAVPGDRRPRVGIVWAGNPALPHDRDRSLPEGPLRGLLAAPGICFVNMQFHVRAPAGFPAMLDPLRDAADFADTAAVVAGLDAVVSVDTAVAHLAGAMGVRVLLLDRFSHCWRWLEGASSTPWYPSMSIHRQSAPGDWSGPVASVLDALGAMRRDAPVVPTDKDSLVLPLPSRPPSGPVHPPAVRLAPARLNIVAFVGQNENGILREASASFMALLEPHGYAGHVVDLFAPDAMPCLVALAGQGIAFAWGAAGIGAGLTSDGKPIWDVLRVPFVSVMSDTPCWAPSNHSVDSRFVANGYLFQDWLDVQRLHVRSPQISALLPLGCLPNPHRDAVPWSRRGNRMLFVKTGGDPEALRAGWRDFPPRFRIIAEEASALALAAPVGDVSGIVADVARASGLVLDGRPEVLFGLMRQVDVYVRDVRSTVMARALLPLPADIVGRGWGHVSAAGGRARFGDPVDASLLPGIYADTRFLVNTMPNFAHRTHERVLAGFASRCCVVTNENADMAARFSGLPTYFPVDLRAGDLTDRLAAIHGDVSSYDDASQPALDLVASDFAPEAFMAGMIALAAEVSAAASPYFEGHAFRRPG